MLTNSKGEQMANSFKGRELDKLNDRLADEADRCRNDGLLDAASLLDEAREHIEILRDRVGHLTNVSEGKSEAIEELRAGLAELKAMCAPGVNPLDPQGVLA